MVHSFEADTFYLFEWNFRYKQVSHHNFGVLIDFFCNIKDSYIFVSRVGLQLNFLLLSVSMSESRDSMSLMFSSTVADVFTYSAFRVSIS